MLESAIHSRWASKGVAALLPASKVFTGQVPPRVTAPYCSLLRTGTVLHARSAQGVIEDVTIRFSIRHDDFDAGRAIAERLKGQGSTGFDDDTFDTSHGSVSLARYQADSYSMADNGLWTFVVDVMFRHYHAHGAI